jgi:hypothetical protein
LFFKKSEWNGIKTEIKKREWKGGNENKEKGRKRKWRKVNEMEIKQRKRRQSTSKKMKGNIIKGKRRK